MHKGRIADISMTRRYPMGSLFNWKMNIFDVEIPSGAWYNLYLNPATECCDWPGFWSEEIIALLRAVQMYSGDGYSMRASSKQHKSNSDCSSLVTQKRRGVVVVIFYMPILLPMPMTHYTILLLPPPPLP